MFTRTKTFKNRDGTTRTYLQIVESRRKGHKIRQKVIANLGRLEELQEGSLDPGLSKGSPAILYRSGLSLTLDNWVPGGPDSGVQPWSFIIYGKSWAWKNSK